MPSQKSQDDTKVNRYIFKIQTLLNKLRIMSLVS